MSKHYDACVCYGRAQDDLGEDLCDQLEKRRLHVFNCQNIDPGQLILESLKQMIQEATYLIVLVTEGDEPWQKDEEGAFTRYWMELKCQSQGKLCTIPVITQSSSYDKLQKDAELHYSKTNIMKFEDSDQFYDELAAKLREKPALLTDIIPCGDLAHGFVYSHFYGYIKLIEKPLRTALREWKADDDDGIVIPCLLMAVPHGAFCKNSVPDYDKQHIKYVGWDVIQKHFRWKINRNGHYKRDYNAMVYRLTNPAQPNKHYYVAIDVPGAVQTLADMAADPGIACAMPEDRIRKETERFVKKMNDILPYHECKAEAFLFEDGSKLSQMLADKCEEILAQSATTKPKLSVTPPKVYICYNGDDYDDDAQYMMENLKKHGIECFQKNLLERIPTGSHECLEETDLTIFLVSSMERRKTFEDVEMYSRRQKQKHFDIVVWMDEKMGQKNTKFAGLTQVKDYVFEKSEPFIEGLATDIKRPALPKETQIPSGDLAYPMSAMQVYGLLSLLLENELLEKFVALSLEEKFGGHMVPVMLEMVPRSYTMKAALTEYNIDGEDDCIKDTGIVKIECRRAGQEKRSYSMKTYQITNPEDSAEVYHAVVDLMAVSPNLTDMSLDPLAVLSPSNLDMYLDSVMYHTKKLLAKKPNCCGKINLVNFDEKSEKRSLASVLTDTCRMTTFVHKYLGDYSLIDGLIYIYYNTSLRFLLPKLKSCMENLKPEDGQKVSKLLIPVWITARSLNDKLAAQNIQLANTEASVYKVTSELQIFHVGLDTASIVQTVVAMATDPVTQSMITSEIVAKNMNKFVMKLNSLFGPEVQAFVVKEEDSLASEIVTRCSQLLSSDRTTATKIEQPRCPEHIGYAMLTDYYYRHVKALDKENFLQQFAKWAAGQPVVGVHVPYVLHLVCQQPDLVTKWLQSEYVRRLEPQIDASQLVSAYVISNPRQPSEKFLVVLSFPPSFINLKDAMTESAQKQFVLHFETLLRLDGQCKNKNVLVKLNDCSSAEMMATILTDACKDQMSDSSSAEMMATILIDACKDQLSDEEILSQQFQRVCLK